MTVFVQAIGNLISPPKSIRFISHWHLALYWNLECELFTKMSAKLMVFWGYKADGVLGYKADGILGYKADDVLGIKLMVF